MRRRHPQLQGHDHQGQAHRAAGRLHRRRRRQQGRRAGRARRLRAHRRRALRARPLRLDGRRRRRADRSRRRGRRRSRDGRLGRCHARSRAPAGGRLPDGRAAVDRARAAAARPGPALRVPGRRRDHRHLSRHRRRLGVDQPGRARPGRRGRQGDLHQDAGASGRSRRRRTRRDTRRDRRPHQGARRRHHRVRARAHRRALRRRPHHRRDHRPQDRRRLHQPQHRPPGRHHLRDRRPGLQVHLHAGRHRRRFRHERGLRRRHRLVPRRAGRKARHRHRRRVRRPGPAVAGAHPPGRTLHGLHGARRDELPVARRGPQRPRGRPRLLDRLQLPEPARARAQDRRLHLLPGRHRLQRRRGRGFRPDPRQGDHRAAAQRRHGRHRHGAAGPRAHGSHRRGHDLPRLGPLGRRLHGQGLRLQALHQRVRHPPVHDRRREDLLGRQVLRPLPQARQGRQRARDRRSRGAARTLPALAVRRGGRAQLGRRPHRGHPAHHVHVRPPAVLVDLLRFTRRAAPSVARHRQGHPRERRRHDRGRTVLPHQGRPRARRGAVRRRSRLRLPAQRLERGDRVSRGQLARLPLGPDAAVRHSHGSASRTLSRPAAHAPGAVPARRRRARARPAAAGRDPGRHAAAAARGAGGGRRRARGVSRFTRRGRAQGARRPRGVGRARYRRHRTPVQHVRQGREHGHPAQAAHLLRRQRHPHGLPAAQGHRGERHRAQHVLELRPQDPSGRQAGRRARAAAHHLPDELQVRARLLHQALHPGGLGQALPHAAVRRAPERRRRHDPLRSLSRQQGLPALVVRSPATTRWPTSATPPPASCRARRSRRSSTTWSSTVHWW